MVRISSHSTAGFCGAMRLVPEELADAVLGAERAPEAERGLVDARLKLIAHGQERPDLVVDGGQDVQVDVAVADMAEAVGQRAGGQLGGNAADLVAVAREAVDGHGRVELDAVLVLRPGCGVVAASAAL